MSDTTTNDNSSAPDQPQQTTVFTEEFKDVVREYCEKDDTRAKLQTQITALRKELSDLEDKIIDFMDKSNLPLFDTGDKGMFKSTTVKKKKGISKPAILTALEKCGHLKDPAKAGDVVSFIYDSLPVETKKELTRK